MRKFIAAGIVLGTIAFFATASQANSQPQSSQVDPAIEQVSHEAEPLCTGGGSACKTDSECCSNRCVTDTMGGKWCGYK